MQSSLLIWVNYLWVWIIFKFDKLVILRKAIHTDMHIKLLGFLCIKYTIHIKWNYSLIVFSYEKTKMTSRDCFSFTLLFFWHTSLLSSQQFLWIELYLTQTRKYKFKVESAELIFGKIQRYVALLQTNLLQLQLILLKFYL